MLTLLKKFLSQKQNLPKQSLKMLMPKLSITKNGYRRSWLATSLASPTSPTIFLAAVFGRARFCMLVNSSYRQLVKLPHRQIAKCVKSSSFKCVKCAKSRNRRDASGLSCGRFWAPVARDAPTTTAFGHAQFYTRCVNYSRFSVSVTAAKPTNAPSTSRCFSYSHQMRQLR